MKSNDSFNVILYNIIHTYNFNSINLFDMNIITIGSLSIYREFEEPFFSAF